MFSLFSDSLVGAFEILGASNSGSELIVGKDESTQKSDNTDVVVPVSVLKLISNVNNLSFTLFYITNVNLFGVLRELHYF